MQCDMGALVDKEHMLFACPCYSHIEVNKVGSCLFGEVPPKESCLIPAERELRLRPPQASFQMDFLPHIYSQIS